LPSAGSVGDGFCDLRDLLRISPAGATRIRLYY
jgi:hypothetical protein